ncbi:Hepadnavirus polymerase/reverse transcriptase [Pleurotus pulmonarius]
MATDIAPLLMLPPPPPTNSYYPDILLRIETPYNADAFEAFFQRFPHLRQQYPNLVQKLRKGFPMGEYPVLDKTVTWPNGKAVEKHRSFVDEYFVEEVKEGRLSGPYSQATTEQILGGPFQCSPITVKVQPQNPGEDPKLRVCIDLSRGTHSYPATNDYSDIRDFPTKFDSALQVAEIVASAPNGAQAMTLDISKFHRRTPLCPAHKRWFVIQSRPGQFYVQHACPFGAKASEGNSGEIANAALAIWKELGVGPVCKWADDMAVFRFPLPNSPRSFPYDRVGALGKIASLGIPWHPVSDKGQDFSHSFTYVGFVWDLSHKTVALPPAKRAAFREKLCTFYHSTTNSREDAMAVQGTLAHIVYVYPLGRTRLAFLIQFISSFQGNETKPLPENVRQDIAWWWNTLGDANVARSLVPRGAAQNLGISVDASGDWGIGILWGKQWAAWKSLPGWESTGRKIGWLEGVAVELAAYFLEAKGVRNTHVLIHSDNQGVIGAFNKGSSTNIQVNLSIQRSGACLLALNNQLKLEYISTEKNPSDPISRGALSSLDPTMRLPDIELPQELRPYLKRV